MDLLTKEQFALVKREAWNSETKELAETGFKLSDDQFDELDESQIDWIKSKMGLRADDSGSGVKFMPKSAGLKKIASPVELRTQLDALAQRVASEKAPSRVEIATELRRIAAALLG